MVDIIRGKNILITGGSGSVGRELIFEVLKCKPNVIRVFDNNESGLFNLQEELKSSKKIRYLFGDVRDKERLDMALADIDFVFHTAALKHVYFCEYSPFEAVKTNIIGIQNLIEAAIDNNVERVMFTSSDKAVNPSNVMGTSKLMGEKLIVAANTYKGKHKTRFSCVRFGNVLGSSGSLLPLIKEQIKKGGPVTITHNDMTRFIMSCRQSIKLLLKTMEMMVGGEIFVLKMSSARISDIIDILVSEMCLKHGYGPRKIKIITIGVKPGEKLYEELMTEVETERAVEIKDMFIILPHFTESELLKPNFYKKYSKFKRPTLKSYNSANLKKLSTKEIKNMLLKEGLLED